MKALLPSRASGDMQKRPAECMPEKAWVRSPNIVLYSNACTDSKQVKLSAEPGNASEISFQPTVSPRASPKRKQQFEENTGISRISHRFQEHLPLIPYKLCKTLCSVQDTDRLAKISMKFVKPILYL